MNEKKKKLLALLGMIAVGLLVTAAVAVYQFEGSDPNSAVYTEYYNKVGWDRAPSAMQRLVMALSDGMLVVGVIYAGIGFMTWIATTGFFDMISYGFSSLWVMFTPFKNPKEHPRFYDYKQAKMEKRKKTRIPLLYVGLGFLALTALFAGLYYVV